MVDTSPIFKGEETEAPKGYKVTQLGNGGTICTHPFPLSRSKALARTQSPSFHCFQPFIQLLPWCWGHLAPGKGTITGWRHGGCTLHPREWSQF